MAKFSMTKQKFQNQWLRNFAKDISKEQLDEYVKDQYIWHIFSYGLVASERFLIGDAARIAYNSKDKIDCIYCDMFGGNGVSNKSNYFINTAEKIDEEFSELYVVAKDYSWTYIKTHEGDNCGPYFFEI